MRRFIISLLMLSAPALARADEVSLFDGSGTAAAYVAVDDELTIYLWSGKPVAYLDRGNSEDFDVYGFNGRHLGWFANGVVFDHRGRAVCAVKEALQTTEFEPFKGFKEFKPFKNFKEFSPSEPAFSNSFGGMPCAIYLAAGSN